MQARRSRGLAAVLRRGVCAGIIESRSGRARVTPSPRSTVRRERDCFVRYVIGDSLELSMDCGAGARYNQGMRVCLCLLALAAFSLHAATPPKNETVHGKLVVRSGEAPVLETAEHKRILLDGDQPTRKVLHDPRVNGLEVEARGHFTAPDKFEIDPQHTRALVVMEGGKRKMITY